MIEWIMANRGVQWRLEETEASDSKVGNGWTVVVRKLSTRTP
jgi:hypothetical protein